MLESGFREQSRRDFRLQIVEFAHHAGEGEIPRPKTGDAKRVGRINDQGIRGEGELRFGFEGCPGVHVVGSRGGLDGGKNFSRVARVGAGVSRLTSAIQKAEPRHMNITGM